jgi:hypothetical protein
MGETFGGGARMPVGIVLRIRFLERGYDREHGAVDSRLRIGRPVHQPVIAPGNRSFSHRYTPLPRRRRSSTSARRVAMSSAMKPKPKRTTPTVISSTTSVSSGR